MTGILHMTNEIFYFYSPLLNMFTTTKMSSLTCDDDYHTCDDDHHRPQSTLTRQCPGPVWRPGRGRLTYGSSLRSPDNVTQNTGSWVSTQVSSTHFLPWAEHWWPALHQPPASGDLNSRITTAHNHHYPGPSPGGMGNRALSCCTICMMLK